MKVDHWLATGLLSRAVNADRQIDISGWSWMTLFVISMPEGTTAAAAALAKIGAKMRRRSVGQRKFQASLWASPPSRGRDSLPHPPEVAATRAFPVAPAIPNSTLRSRREHMFFVCFRYRAGSPRRVSRAKSRLKISFHLNNANRLRRKVQRQSRSRTRL